MAAERTGDPLLSLPYIDLACSALAGGLWYAFPRLGPWPLLLALAPWLARWVLTGRLSRRTPYDLPLILFLLAAAIGVWSAYNQPVAWSKFWLICGGVLIFYAFANSDVLGEQREWLLALFGAGVGLYFVATHNWHDYPVKIDALNDVGAALQALLPPVPGHRLHPNVVGGILAMIFPFAGAMIIGAWQRLRWVPQPRAVAPWLLLAAGLGSATAILFALLMTTSRGAWIALASALAVAALWQLAAWLAKGKSNRRVWIFAALALLSATLGLVLVLAYPQMLVDLTGFLPGGNTAIDRQALLGGALTLVRDYPLIGAGLGGFQMLYSSYVLLTHVGHSVHSHNLFLNVAVELGIPALLLLIWMWILFGARVLERLRHPVGVADSRMLGAAALSLTAVLIHSLVDDPLFGSRAVLLLFVPLAFSVAVPLRGLVRGGAWRAVAPPAVLLLLLLTALIWRTPILTLAYSNLGAVHQSKAELGVYAWPDWPIQDEVRRAVDLDLPIAQYGRALALNRGNPTANRRLGQIELSRGDYEGAVAHLTAARNAQPDDLTARQLLAEALIVTGQTERGQALWSSARNAQGQLDGRLWWYEHIGEPWRADQLKTAVGDK